MRGRGVKKKEKVIERGGREGKGKEGRRVERKRGRGRGYKGFTRVLHCCCTKERISSSGEYTDGKG